MAPPYTGRCFCEAVQYRITEEPLTFYACHCTDCQKRSGSAFGLSSNTRLWSEPENRPGLAVARPGTLDNTSWLLHELHQVIGLRACRPRAEGRSVPAYGAIYE